MTKMGVQNTFRVVAKSGLMTVIAATGPVFSMRWTSSEVHAMIKKVNLWWVTITAFGAAQLVEYDLFKVNNFSVVDSGGLAVTPASITPLNSFVSGLWPKSALNDMRISDTAALTAGTRTPDTYPIFTRASWSAGIGQGLFNPVGKEEFDNPIVLKANEGLVLANSLVMGATGVTKLRFELEWDEVLA